MNGIISQDSQSAFRHAERLRQIGVSDILKMADLAVELRRQGRDVISLSAGQPDFDTPEHIKEAAARAMSAGHTKYTVLDGTAELKSAIQEKFKRENKLDFSLSEISVSSGAKQVLFNAMMATIDPGDEVIIPAPFWVTYADIVRIAGGKPVFISCPSESGFRLSAEALDRAITPRTRWLLLNSPSNPSGAAYMREQYRPLLDVLLRRQHVWLLVDDIYEHIIYDGLGFATPAAIEPALRERTLTVNGVSKAYAMTGWRVGYGAGPTDLIAAMATVQSQSTSCASSISQAAAVAALTGSQGFIRDRCHSFQARRDLMVAGLNSAPGIHCRKPEGAFYAFANCDELLWRQTSDGIIISTDVEFASYLLRSVSVAVVPGSAFGSPGHFRVSYAASTENLMEACQRIITACEELH